jgi:hypothetical protein
MPKEERPRQRANQRTSSKVPLTFYRSGDSQSPPSSPFKDKSVPQPSMLKRFFTGLLDILLIVILLACLIYSLFIKPTPKVIVNSELYHSKSTYKDAAHRYLSAVKNRNKITFDDKSIVNSMQNQFPEISAAYVELPVFAQTPIIHLNVSNPVLILKNNEKSYAVTTQGVAVNGSGHFDSKHLTVVEDQSGFSTKAGQQVMSTASVKFIEDLLKQLERANVKVSGLILPPKAQELDLRTIDKSYYVKFYLGGDVLQQTGQFLAARQQFDKDGTQPSEYLDVRVPGKIYFK